MTCHAFDFCCAGRAHQPGGDAAEVRGLPAEPLEQRAAHGANRHRAVGPRGLGDGSRDHLEDAPGAVVHRF